MKVGDRVRLVVPLGGYEVGTEATIISVDEEDYDGRIDLPGQLDHPMAFHSYEVELINGTNEG